MERPFRITYSLVTNRANHINAIASPVFNDNGNNKMNDKLNATKQEKHSSSNKQTADGINNRLAGRLVISSGQSKEQETQMNNLTNGNARISPGVENGTFLTFENGAKQLPRRPNPEWYRQQGPGEGGTQRNVKTSFK